jgi:hypothetical protein
LAPDDIDDRKADALRASLADQEDEPKLVVATLILMAMDYRIPSVRIAEAILLGDLRPMVAQAQCYVFYDYGSERSRCLDRAGPSAVEPYGEDDTPGESGPNATDGVEPPDDPIATTTTTVAATTTTTTSTTTTAPEPAGLPWTYEGVIEREQTYIATFGARGRNTAINEDRFVVTLLPGGTVEGSITRGGNGSVFGCDPENAGQIYPTEVESEVTQITTWTHSDGVLILPEIPGGSTGGTYDAETMELTWSYTSDIGPLDGCFEGTFIVEESWNDATIPRVDPPAGR